MSIGFDKPRRRCFRVSLKSFLLLVATVGGLSGWFCRQAMWIHERNQSWSVPIGETGCWIAGGTPGAAPWSLKPFRAAGYDKILVQTQLRSTDEGRRDALAHAKALFPEADLSLEIHFGVCISPEDQAYLRDHPELKPYVPRP